MDGMLSQDEINALLSGMNAGSSDPQPDPQPAATEEILTDIEKMLVLHYNETSRQEN